MTRYTIDYSTLPENEREAKALNDVKFYLGKKEFNRLVKVFRAENEKAPVDLRTFEVNLAFFVGIEGHYPIRAFYKHVFPEAKLDA